MKDRITLEENLIESRNKTLTKLAIALWAVLCGVLFIMLNGCATSPVPTAWEQKVFDINTNMIPKIVVVTNVVEKTNYAVVTVTNTVDVVTAQVVPVTNVTLVTEWETNVLTLTNQVEIYHYTPNTNAALLTSIARKPADPFGWGGVVGTAVAGFFAAYAAYRNRQNAARAAGLGVEYAQSQATAAALAQIIETGRAVLQTTAQGQAIDAKWKEWMIAHQVETGTIQNVLALLNNVVDEASAKVVAGELSQMIQERTAPTTPPSTKA